MQHKDNWKHEPTLVKKGRCVVTNSGTESRLQHNRLWSTITQNEICMRKFIESKIKFWTKVGVKLPTLRQIQVTRNEVTLSSLVTSDLCQNHWILNESTNMQETRRIVTHRTQGIRLVTNQHKVLRRSNIHFQSFHC